MSLCYVNDCDGLGIYNFKFIHREISVCKKCRDQVFDIHVNFENMVTAQSVEAVKDVAGLKEKEPPA